MVNRFFIFLSIIIISSCNSSSEPNDAYLKLKGEEATIRNFYNRVLNDKKFTNDSIKIQIEKIDSIPINSNYYQAVYNIAKASYYNRIMSFNLAEYNFSNALNTLKSKPNDSIAERAYVGIGTIYKKKGDFTKSLLFFQKSIKACEFNNDTIRLSGAYASLAQVYFEKDDVLKAKENIEKVFKLLANKKSEIPYLISLHTLANIELKAGNIEKAFLLDQQGLKIADSLNSDKIKVTFQDNLARCYLYKKEYSKAESYFNKNLEIDTKLNNPNWIADTYINLAELKMLTGDFENAEKKLQLAIDILLKNNLSNNTLKAYSVLSDLYQKQGNYKKALEIKDEYLKNYKNIINEKREESFVELDLLFETSKKEKALTTAKLALTENELLSKRKSIWLMFLSSIVIIGFILFRNIRAKAKLQKEQLELENKLLEEQSNYKIQEQRLDISRELHDNVGSQLTFIISILDNLKSSSIQFDEAIDKKIDSLTNFANKSISELRDTIWVLNSKQLSLSELKSRMTNFIKDASESVETIQFQFDFDIQNDVQLSSKQAINLYRILQEIVNNAIKHANAKDISVSISQIENELQIKISDNGIGVDYESKKKKSFGLTNVQNRVQEVNGSLQVESNEAKGTNYSITVKL
jgi:signal transduction histidine kinase